jgi:transposase-like protein
LVSSGSTVFPRCPSYDKLHFLLQSGPATTKYLNNLIEQDHQAVKRLVRPMLGFKSFWAARCTIAGIEVMHAICKGQLVNTGEVYQTPAEQFYSLAA